MSRNKSMVALRPEIPSIKTMGEITDAEEFQNRVIRPILKYQHDIIVRYTISKAVDRNNKFESLIAVEKERYLDKVTLKDNKLKQELCGMVLGLMTLDELINYLKKESEFRRRINTMIRERIVSTF